MLYPLSYEGGAWSMPPSAVAHTAGATSGS